MRVSCQPQNQRYLTLIERHISHLLEKVGQIWIPTRPQNAALLELLEVPGEKVVLLSVNSKTMSETVLRVLDVSSASHFSMFMPDTYCLGEQPYEFMIETSDLSLALWRIRQEQMGKLGQVNLDDATGNLNLVGSLGLE